MRRITILKDYNFEMQIYQFKQFYLQNNKLFTIRK